MSRIQRSPYVRLTESLWVVALVLGLISGAQSLGRFHRGRFSDGFMGAPSKHGSLQREKDTPDMWYTQKLDHFDETNTNTWKQRYYVNSEHYANHSGAPVFLMIGGEGEAAKKWMHQGAWIHYAEHFGALCFQLEHRFYGQSHPTSDLSTQNLSYLTSKQALADLADFVRAMKREYNLDERQKWIVFGGSYPGSLAAWAREKYPDLIYGGISSSGPLLAKLDFVEYFDVVVHSLASYSADCVEAVRRSFDQVDILMRHMIGQRNLDEQFQTCTPIKDSVANPLDVTSFYENLASNFAGVVQYNKDNSPMGNITIDQVCDVMLNTTIGAPVARLAKINAMLLERDEKKCLDYKYDKMIGDMKETSWQSESAKGGRQWTYQTCNEFGFYQTAEQADSTFGNRFGVDFFIRQCMDIYSEKMDAKYLASVISSTNSFYGALRPNTTNVLYVHGSIDPWHALGLIAPASRDTPTIYIDGTAHCANMYEPMKTDFPQLVMARNKILKFLAKLVSSYQPV